MKAGLFLDVVIGKGAAVLELLPSEDQALLIWRNAFLVLNLRLDIVDGVGRLNLEGDGFTRKGLHEAVDDSSAASQLNRLSCVDLHLHCG